MHAYSCKCFVQVLYVVYTCIMFVLSYPERGSKESIKSYILHSYIHENPKGKIIAKSKEVKLVINLKLYETHEETSTRRDTGQNKTTHD